MAPGCSSRAAASRLELADVFRAHADTLRPLTPVQAQAVRAILNCRTAALGGHLRECDRCGHREISYNSCRNRHCPKCQGLERARWVEARRADLLPVPYHHVVFTVPRELHPLFLANPKIALDLLFRAVSETLLEVAANPKRLGARIGFTSVLHTWTQTLLYHPHLHVIAPAGGLSPGGKRWISAEPGFFLPVHVLSKVFRGKLLSMLEAASGAGRIRQSHGDVTAILEVSARKRWVVYSKPPLAGPDSVLGYLGRYTHRVAISNERLVGLGEGRVTFGWKDRAHGNQDKLMTLEAPQFLRRFLLHVLPKRLVRIRHYGFLANSVRRRELALCRTLLGASPVPAPEVPPASTAESWKDLLLRLTGRDVTRCNVCGLGRLQDREILPPRWLPRSIPGLGTAS